MPTFLITLLTLATSAFIVLVSWSGELPTTSAPVLKSLAFVSAKLRNRTISWFSRLTIAAGVPAGPNMHNVDTDSYPGRPEAATVGNSGNAMEGCAPETAKALNLPDLICGSTETT